jgi:hypothetical protein
MLTTARRAIDLPAAFLRKQVGPCAYNMRPLAGARSLKEGCSRTKAYANAAKKPRRVEENGPVLSGNAFSSDKLQGASESHVPCSNRES